MDDYTEIMTKVCQPHINVSADSNSCNNIILKLPKSEVNKLQFSMVSNNPPLGEFNMNILGAGLGLVLIFYVLGYGLGRIIKMVNL
ncbi:hypothetical protein [Xenorhabdus bovienii]|uniref:Uncharacterized protein n=1 Tax=Xenorhabdus bovienii str. kraussei Becker Underwood TaxID=1398204 RepID=A0A077PSS4_XENBV|nr:hypothetical protein [Xenorhabdus bovienii]CDH24078.1 conserved hypothetical protein [Xenorhabdus bovienii str. kraussei Becker Underwood]